MKYFNKSAAIIEDEAMLLSHRPFGQLVVFKNLWFINWQGSKSHKQVAALQFFQTIINPSISKQSFCRQVSQTQNVISQISLAVIVATAVRAIARLFQRQY